MRLAVIDLGTNTVRLLVAELRRGMPWVSVHAEQRVTRLGERLRTTGVLGDAAMARTAAAVTEYVARAQAAGASSVRVVATSAMREAQNGQAFAERLAQAGGHLSLAFISLDDDERQLEEFLAAQPEAGVRSTFWLREGHERDEWLASAGIGRDPSLPVQLLVDPKGKVRCTVNGAVMDGDYAEIAAIVSGP